MTGSEIQMNRVFVGRRQSSNVRGVYVKLYDVGYIGICSHIRQLAPSNNIGLSFDGETTWDGWTSVEYVEIEEIEE